MGNKIKQYKKRFFYPPEFENTRDNLNKNGRFTADLMIKTGARISECRWFVENPVFDKERNNIILLRTKVRARLGEKRPEPRTLPLSKSYFNQLNKDIKTHKVLSTNAFNIQLRKAAAAALVPSPEQFSSHNLRKTFATWMLSLGVLPHKLAAHLGHTERELLKDYSTNDVFNANDKMIMRSIFKELPMNI